MKRISLQTKISVLITGLLLFITILLTTSFSYIDLKQTEKEIGVRALQIASTISLMPTIRSAFSTSNPEEVIQPIAKEIQEFVDAEFIVIGNADSIRYAHPDEEKIGKKMVGGDNDRALINGEYYTSKADGSLGPSLRGKAPIFDDDGNVIGIVSVGFMVEDIRSIIFRQVLKMSGAALVVLLLGLVGGVLLARNIRKETFGLEPHQIASLYRDRSAILSSIKEGIIAIDKDGNINMMNESAQKLLKLPKKYTFKKIEDIVPDTKMYDVLTSGEPMRDDEMVLNNIPVIVNRTPIKGKDGKVEGVVASFRDKTEINEMLATLSEIRRYSEDLRAQTHEYTNKLYVLSGLLQLEYYEEAIALIQRESEMHGSQHKVLLDQVKDKTVQAILLGKISKASEKKIKFSIDPNTFLHEIPEHVDIGKLITILGNLLDNAIEAVQFTDVKQVTFFATDVGEDIIFEVADSGSGIGDEDSMRVFERGYSTKEMEYRGFGLSIVKDTVTELGGAIEFHNQASGGAVFSVFLPKVIKDEEKAGRKIS